MILLKRPHQSSESSTYYCTNIRRRLNDSSTVSISRPQSTKSLYPPLILHVPSSNETQSRISAPLQGNSSSSFTPEQQPCPIAEQLSCSPKTTMTSLPQEILLQIFSNLPVIDLIRSSRTCRKFYNLSDDQSLMKHLDFSNFSFHYLPRPVATKLRNTHSLIVPGFSSARCPEIVLKDSLSFASHSTHLTTITLRDLTRGFIPFLHNFFLSLKSTKLAHVDLARTPIPDHLITVLLNRYGNTLVSLDLEFSVLTDSVLDKFSSKNGTVTKLKELGLAACMNLSKDRLRKFLSEDGECPVGIEKLNIGWALDLEPEWVEQWLSRKQKAEADGAKISGMVDMRGCTKVNNKDVEEMRKKWIGVEFIVTKEERL